jgi:hypothetical protein
MRDAKRHQRCLIVSLLDLRNAFGEIHHGLIKFALEHHHVPADLIAVFCSIYDNFKVTVSCNNSWSDAMVVERGVLQGDPASPLIFNLCFNILMRTLNSQKHRELEYEWGGVKGRRYTSWLQYADDAAIVSRSGMVLRLDKCCTFGMAK